MERQNEESVEANVSLETDARNKRAFSLAGRSFALKEARKELSRLLLNEFMR